MAPKTRSMRRKHIPLSKAQDFWKHRGAARFAHYYGGLGAAPEEQPANRRKMPAKKPSKKPAMGRKKPAVAQKKAKKAPGPAKSAVKDEEDIEGRLENGDDTWDEEDTLEDEEDEGSDWEQPPAKKASPSKAQKKAKAAPAPAQLPAPAPPPAQIPPPVQVPGQVPDDISVVPAGWTLKRGQVVGPCDGRVDIGYFVYFFINGQNKCFVRIYKRYDNFDFGNAASLARLNRWRRAIVRADPVTGDVPDTIKYIWPKKNAPVGAKKTAAGGAAAYTFVPGQSTPGNNFAPTLGQPDIRKFFMILRRKSTGRDEIYFYRGGVELVDWNNVLWIDKVRKWRNQINDRCCIDK